MGLQQHQQTRSSSIILGVVIAGFIILWVSIRSGNGCQQCQSIRSDDNEKHQHDAGDTIPAGYRQVKPMGSNATVLVPIAVRSAEEIREWNAYQDDVIKTSAEFRFRPIENSHQMTASFYEYWLVRRARNRYMTDRIYLPLDWYECVYVCPEESKQNIRKYLDTLDKRYSYFTLFAVDRGMAWWGITVPRDMDILVFSSDGTTRAARDIRIPLLMDVLEPQGKPKDIKVSSAFSVGTHAIRKDVVKLWETWVKEPGFEQMNYSSKTEYAGVLERSNFTLCPRGIGPISFRVFEAMQVITIPIFIWKYDLPLPYADLVDWNQFAIVAHADDLSSLRSKVDNFDVENAQRILREIRHMWSYQYINEYVVRRLETEQLAPIPKSAYADEDHRRKS